MIRTWQLEIAAVVAVLAAVAIASGGGAIELVGAGAVALSFAHAQVADQLAEAERERRAFVRFADADTDAHAVTCHRWATRYLVGKENALAGVFRRTPLVIRARRRCAVPRLHAAYTPWRPWWRARRPLGRS